MWTLSFAALSFVGLTFILKYWDGQTSPVFNAFFLIAYRNIWALSMAWFIFAFEYGSWKWLGDVLSHKLWLPLGRLGLSLYLVHPALQIALLSSQKHPISYDSFQMVRRSLASRGGHSGEGNLGCSSTASASQPPKSWDAAPAPQPRLQTTASLKKTGTLWNRYCSPTTPARLDRACRPYHSPICRSMPTSARNHLDIE